MVTTGLELPGYRINKSLGVVRGVTVRSNELSEHFVAKLKSFAGGKIDEYVNLCKQTMPKHTPNSFFETRLSSILNENNINSFVVCGMMSHMCIDTTVRAAKDYAIDITLVEDACATKDLSFHGVTISTRTVHCAFMAGLSGIFAKVIGASELKILP